MSSEPTGALPLSQPAAPPLPVGGKRRLRWHGLVGLLASLGLIWWALRGVTLDEVLGPLREAEPLPLLAMVAFAAGTLPLRAMRWQYYLRLGDERPSLAPLWHATTIGFMANNLLPARIGEVARAFAAQRLTGMAFARALASIGVERLMDGLTIVLMLAVGLVLGSIPSEAAVGGMDLGSLALVAAAFCAAGLLAALCLIWWRGPVILLVERACAGLLPERWRLRAVGMLGQLIIGLETLHHPGRFAGFLAWSILLWGCNAAAIWCGFVAFGIPASWSAAFILQAIIAFAVMIPSSPGFFGPFEAATRATLAVYAIEPGVSVSYAVSYHLSLFGTAVIFGLWSLWRSGIRLAAVRRAAAPPA